MNKTNCQRCDAPIRGLVCDYCGTLHHPPVDAAEEKAAWVEFLGILQTKEPEVQIRLLQNGFLPDSVPTLIDAGLHSMGLLDLSSTADDLVQAAYLRLQAVVAKLKILPTTAESDRAIMEFEQALRAYKKADKQVMQAVLIVTVVTLLACGGWLFWLFWGG
jgi:hypothetical protein